MESKYFKCSKCGKLTVGYYDSKEDEELVQKKIICKDCWWKTAKLPQGWRREVV